MTKILNFIYQFPFISKFQFYRVFTFYPFSNGFSAANRRCALALVVQSITEDARCTVGTLVNLLLYQVKV